MSVRAFVSAVQGALQPLAGHREGEQVELDVALKHRSGGGQHDDTAAGGGPRAPAGGEGGGGTGRGARQDTCQKYAKKGEHRRGARGALRREGARRGHAGRGGLGTREGEGKRHTPSVVSFLDAEGGGSEKPSFSSRASGG